MNLPGIIPARLTSRGCPLLLFVALLISSLSLPAVEPREEIIRDLGQWPMFAAPQILQPLKKSVHSAKLLPLWLAALATTEKDLQRQAADNVLLAIERGVGGLDVMIPGLLKLVNQPEQDPLVLRSACSALIALDHKQAGPDLLKLSSQGQLSLSQIIEPGLAAWNTPGAVEIWKSRLEAGQLSQQLTLLAIICLRRSGDKSSLPGLSSLAIDARQPAKIRIEAARSIAQLADAPALAAVEKLRQSNWQEGPGGWLNRYLAAYLLSPALDDQRQATILLRQLALDDDGSIATVALQSLLVSQPEQVVMLASQQRDHPDSHVRFLLARAIHQQVDTATVGMLVEFLDDSHRPLRLQLRDWLITMLADPTLGPEVARQLERLRPAMEWRAAEQLVQIMVAVPGTADRDWIMAQTENSRPEVFVTSAWAVRRLKISEALPGLLKRVIAGMQQLKEGSEIVVPAAEQDDLVEQMCHVMLAFGEMQYVDAETQMFQLVRKDPVYPFIVRASATWAIGLLSVDQPNKQVPTEEGMTDLAEELRARIADQSPFIQEGAIVKRMAAVTLARMRSVDSLPLMEEFFLSSALDSPLKWTLAWAIHDLGGDKIDVPEFIEVQSQGWFLEPADN
jgi:hypothetical protein